ncbi:MAG: sigma-70 family RNA polymerase sigma factor [Bacteroidota bacterium]
MADLSDEELINSFKQGNTNQSFNLLVHKYQQKLYWHIRHLVIDHDDANDITQETFIKAWNNLANFREDAQLYTWLYRIATNEALSFLKKKKTRFLVPLIGNEKYLSEKIESDSHFSGDDIQKKFQKALIKLPEKQRVVFNLRYYDEMPYEKMSEILGTSTGALKASYHHAVKKIEDFFKTI